jgi:hypothetical protein
VKTCVDCGEVKPFEDFYRNRGMKDGRANRCKACQRVVTATWKRKNAEHVRAVLRRWKEQNPDAVRGHYSGWRERNREKLLAHRAVKAAVRSGRLSRPEACESCERVAPRLEAHHADYAKQLEVKWLCRSCHLAEHKELDLAAALPEGRP